VFAVLILLVGLLGFVTFRFVTARPVAVAPVAAPVAAAPTTPPPAGAPAPRATTPPATPPPSSTEPLPPREEKPVAAAPRPAHVAKIPRRPIRENNAPIAEHAAPAAAAPVERPPPKGDKLDDLLNSALGTKRSPAAAAPRAREEEEPARKQATLGTLSKEDMVRGMQGVTPRVRDCFAQYKVPGVAMVKVNVARGGRVSTAAVSGKFAGTPTGTCIESAVKGAHFPPVEGQSFDYPFPLH
jgi:hypothetical protein